MGVLRRRGGARHQFHRVGTLAPPAGYDALIAVSAGPEGPVAMWGTSFQSQVALVSYSPGSLRPDSVTVVTGFPVAHPFIQPLPDGDWLVVGARCAWREDGPEENALVIGPDGQVKLAGTVGDGIEHVLVDVSGSIWAGYFDEGIFGNLGWGSPGPEPLGSTGIVQWSRELEKRWEYQAVDRYWLADCYALNVGREVTWACPYTDFPIVQIDADRVSVRPTAGVRGPKGLVVAGDVVGVIGSYDDGGSLMLGKLDDPSQLATGRLAMPGGGPVPRHGLVCRDSVAHLFVGADWFVFDLAGGS